MTYGECVLATLRETGPLAREELCEEAAARYGIPVVMASTALFALQYRGEVVLEDGRYSLPPTFDPLP
jgi:hypothetical protein